MAQPEARIRPYNSADKKLVLFMISKANFQALAVANNKAYFHPISLAIWIALSSAFMQSMSWWPHSSYGWLGYLRPLPAFASVAVPLMFFVDWINRPYFEALTEDVLKQADLTDIGAYYSRDPASGFWLLEYGNTFVGLIGVDASQPSKKDKKGEPKDPKTATIRHFHVEENFRKANPQVDLLTYAVDRAFHADPKLQRIEAADSPLVSYLRPCLRSAGFELDHHTKTVGIFRWAMGTRYLEREKWSKKSN